MGHSGAAGRIAQSVVRLLGPDISMQGSVKLYGRELTKLSETEMQKVRGGAISMIPMTPTLSPP